MQLTTPLVKLTCAHLRVIKLIPSDLQITGAHRLLWSKFSNFDIHFFSEKSLHRTLVPPPMRLEPPPTGNHGSKIKLLALIFRIGQKKFYTG